jgi:hypothetical protein
VSPLATTTECGDQVDARPLVPVGVGRETFRALKLIVASDEDVCSFDDIALDPTRHGHDLPHSSVPRGVDADMDNEIHACRDGWHDKGCGDVFTGQQWKRAHLHQRLSS